MTINKKIMFSVLKSLKKKFIEKNTYLSLQLLFTWAGFKILGFLSIPFLYRVGFSLFCFLILFVYWKRISCYIVNNLLFQYYLFVFLYLINVLIKYRYLPFLLAFFFSLGFGLMFNVEIIIAFVEKGILIPRTDFIFVMVFLFGFVHKLCNNVFYEEMKNAFVIDLSCASNFTWFYIVNLFNSYFKGEIKIINRISENCYSYFPYTSFPFSSNFLHELAKSENSFFIFFGRLGGIKNLETKEEEKSFALFNDQRLKSLSNFISEHQKMNNKFYWSVLLGFLSGFLAVILFLNNNCFVV